MTRRLFLKVPRISPPCFPLHPFKVQSWNNSLLSCSLNNLSQHFIFHSLPMKLPMIKLPYLYQHIYRIEDKLQILFNLLCKIEDFIKPWLCGTYYGKLFGTKLVSCLLSFTTIHNNIYLHLSILTRIQTANYLSLPQTFLVIFFDNMENVLSECHLGTVEVVLKMHFCWLFNVNKCSYVWL